MAKSKKKNKGSGRKYSYSRPSESDVDARAKGGGKYDQIVKIDAPFFTAKEGVNAIRILPALWKNAKHFGVELNVHYGVGTDNQKYLCRKFHLGEPDPIFEEYDRAKRDEEDEKYIKELRASQSVLCFMIDRDNPDKGPTLYQMPYGLDKEIAMQRRTKKGIIWIEDVEAGFDVEFTRTGKGMTTKYGGVRIDRDPTPLSDDDREIEKWMDFVEANPIPDILQVFDYDHIAREFNGGSSVRKDLKAGKKDKKPKKDKSKKGGEDTGDDEPYSPPTRSSRGSSRVDAGSSKKDKQAKKEKDKKPKKDKGKKSKKALD